MSEYEKLSKFIDEILASKDVGFGSDRSVRVVKLKRLNP